MRKRREWIVAAVIGVLLLAPIGITGYSALITGRQAAVTELERLTSHVQRQAAGTRAQIDAAVGALNAETTYAPCTPSQIQQMSRLLAGSTYVQGLGYVRNNALVCSTLNNIQQTVALGPADQIGPDGSKTWNGITLPSIPGIQFNISATNGHAAITVPDLVGATLDIDGRISLAQIGIGSGTWFRTKGVFKPAWLERYQGDAITFSDGDYLVDMHPSDDGQFAALAAMPISIIDEYVERALRDKLPLGVLIGLLLAGTAGLIARRQLSGERRAGKSQDQSRAGCLAQNA
ncbi:hypothetical protein FXN63_12495 [Pigmentiphaga aceris]|uniref:Putative cyclic diguanylate phosphodiesterase CSS motif-containing domain-containing protein n=1 Tax=Pigmentiphaga aceris TaxID=1940612 RepID=A0A5C0AW73_9BURK|nr:CSS-motif domain-containing protein [Pigmentiphaga aceris]QEI06558.1 hypothetical protein FXN63_12495 [Pigmentiphaga aceris]